MGKVYAGPWVIRSLLFTPGHLEELIPKAARAGADLLALDLEDAVPLDKKATAREVIRGSLEQGVTRRVTTFVRLNEFSTGWTQADIDAVACEWLHGFIFPMVRLPSEIETLDALLGAAERRLGLRPGHFSLIPLIETASGVLQAYPIARASRRTVALLFGGEDYLADMGGRHDPTQLAFHVPRVQVVMAARAAGIEPVDTPHVDTRDEEGMRAHCVRGRDLGMSGVLVMSPRQIPLAHEIYTPSEDELDEAHTMLASLGETRREGRGLTVRDGKYISPVAERKARNVLERSAAIQAMGAEPDSAAKED